MASSVFFIKWTGALKDVSKIKSHAKYVGFRSNERGDSKGFFDKNTDKADYKEFIKRIENNPALQHSKSIKAHKMLFALKQEDYEIYKRSGKDFKDIVRQTLSKYEEKHNVKLDWIANIHNGETKNPHVHIIIKGVSDIKGDRGYTRIKFTKDDFKELREYYKESFEKDARYKFHEREEIKEVIKETSRGFEAVLRAIEKEAQKEQFRAEFEKEIVIEKTIRDNERNSGRER